MKLGYRILWIDDNIDAFEDDGFIEKVENHLIEEGFIAKIDRINDSSKLDLKSIENNSFDLILTDYNMEDKNGSQIINEIRDNSVFTEILFYTAQKEWDNKTRFDRVTFLQTSKKIGESHHERVFNEVIKIINLTIQKFQHIVTMRGMIMHETSSLDAQVNKILNTYISCKDKQSCQSCDLKVKCDPISEKVINEIESQLNTKLDIAKSKKFNKIKKDTFLFSAYHKQTALSTILNAINSDDFTAAYKKDVNNIRNTFAHAVLEVDPKTGEEIFNNKAEGLEFNADLCKKIRKDISKYKSLLDEVERLLFPAKEKV